MQQQGQQQQQQQQQQHGRRRLRQQQGQQQQQQQQQRRLIRRFGRARAHTHTLVAHPETMIRVFWCFVSRRRQQQHAPAAAAAQAEAAAAIAGPPIGSSSARWVTVPIGTESEPTDEPEPTRMSEPDEATLMKEGADADAADEARRSEFGPHW